MKIICSLLMTVMVSTAKAATYWVAPNGNDGNSCASIQGASDPGIYRATANGAIACLNEQSGHTVMVKPGYYFSGDYWINNPPSGTIFISQVKLGAKVYGGKTTGKFAGIDGGRSFITIRGFEVYDINSGIGLCGNICGQRGGPYSTNWIIEDNYFHHTQGTAFIQGHDTSLQNHVFRRNRFSHIGIYSPGYRPGMNVLYNIGNGTLIENNIFHDIVNGPSDCGGGEHPDSAGGCNGPYNPTTGTVIRNNVFYNVGRCDLHPWMIGANISNPLGAIAPGTTKIYGNLIYDSGCDQVPFVGLMLALYGAEGANEFYNNTLYNIRSGAAIWNGPGYTGARLRNNIVYGAARQIELNGLPAANVSNNLCGSAGEGCAIVGNPSFVNINGGDFHLNASSPAIDRGANVGLPYSGSSPDIGAYEYGASSVSTPQAPATANATLTLSATSAQPSSSVSVSVKNAPGNATDWVGLYRVGDNDVSFLDWKYLNNSQSAPSGGVNSATLNFSLPENIGSYEFRFFSTNGFSRLAVSAMIVVMNGPKLSVSATTVSPGQSVTVNVNGGPGNAKDWVGLYKVGAADRSFLNWKYLNNTKTAPATGMTAGKLTFKMPATPGEYEFRFYENDGYTMLAKSVIIRVQ
jgi:hypothetical protein